MVSTVTRANVRQDTLEIIVKLVRHLHLSYQSKFVWPEVISKFKKLYIILNKPKFHTNAILLTFLSSYRFSKTLMSVLIAHVKMAVPV